LPPQQTSVGSKHYILYVPGPTCRGPVPLCMSPFSYKRGDMRRYTHTSNLRSHLRLTSSYKLTSNTSHSGVGYYAPAARTTLNPCVFLRSSRSYQRPSKTPKPLLISGFRAGALRHPAGDLLSNNFHALLWSETGFRHHLLVVLQTLHSPCQDVYPENNGMVLSKLYLRSE
jgi:hypothetical protein